MHSVSTADAVRICIYRCSYNAIQWLEHAGRHMSTRSVIFVCSQALRTNILTKYVSDAENDPRVTVRVKQVGSTEAARKQYDLYWKLAYRFAKTKSNILRSVGLAPICAKTTGPTARTPRFRPHQVTGTVISRKTRLWFHMLLQHPCGSPWYRRIFPRSQYSWLCQYRAETCKASELGRW